jgi:hypothetical protein
MLDLGEPDPTSRQARKAALAATLKRVAAAGGWEEQASRYGSAALRNALVADVAAAVGAREYAGGGDGVSQTAKFLTRAMYAVPVRLEGAALVGAVNGLLCASSLARIDERMAGQLRALADAALGARWRPGSGADEGLWQRVAAALVDGLCAWVSTDKEPAVQPGAASATVAAALFGQGAQATARGEGLTARRGGILSDWRQPHLLLDLYAILESEDQGAALLIDILRAALHLGPSPSLEEFRFSHPDNVKHLQALDPEVVRKWMSLRDAPFQGADLGEGGAGQGGVGTRDLEALLMMGEDMRTCMSIDSRSGRSAVALLLRPLQRLELRPCSRSSHATIVGMAACDGPTPRVPRASRPMPQSLALPHLTQQPAPSSNKRTLKGLLSYMAAANVRILTVCPSVPPPARACASHDASGDEEAGEWLSNVDVESSRVWRGQSVAPCAWYLLARPIGAGGSCFLPRLRLCLEARWRTRCDLSLSHNRRLLGCAGLLLEHTDTRDLVGGTPPEAATVSMRHV